MAAERQSHRAPDAFAELSAIVPDVEIGVRQYHADGPQAIADARKELADARSAQKGAHLKGAVDVRSIIKKADALPEVEKVALGPDFDDEEEVPPLQ